MDPSTQFSEIEHFYKNKVILLIGATGFVGKLVLEKILRNIQVKHVYLIIRPKEGKDAETICAEIFDSKAFDPLKRTDPEFYEKVSLMQGDLEKPDLGLNEVDYGVIVDEVNCIFHCGSISKLDTNLNVATKTNVRALRDLLVITKKMKHLTAFIFLSTVYSNFPKYEIHEQFYDPPIQAEELIDSCEKEELLDSLLGEWPNAYTFTMSVAEDLIKTEGNNLPVSIVRPSIILPSEKEPITGYVDKSFGLIEHSVYHALGINRINYYTEGTLDIIPVDYVVNLLIASGWFAGLQRMRVKRGDVQTTDVTIYHCISSYEKPVSTGEWMGITHTVFRDVPSSKMIQLPTAFNTSCYYNYRFLTLVLHYFMGFLCDTGLKLAGMTPTVLDMYAKLHKSQELFSPYLNKQWYFDNDSTQKLLKRMSFKDRDVFNFDIMNLNWQTYFVNYARGIRVYLLKDPMSTLTEGRKKQHNKLVIQLISAVFLVTILYIITKVMYRIVF